MSTNVRSAYGRMSWGRLGEHSWPPDEELALARHSRVPGVALVRPLLIGKRQADAERREMARVQAQEGRVVRRGVGESREQRDGGQRDDRPSYHPGAGAQLGALAQHKCAALHLQAGEIAYRTADDDRPALHPHADLEAGAAVDDNGP